MMQAGALPGVESLWPGHDNYFLPSVISNSIRLKKHPIDGFVADLIFSQSANSSVFSFILSLRLIPLLRCFIPGLYSWDFQMDQLLQKRGFF